MVSKQNQAGRKARKPGRCKLDNLAGCKRKWAGIYTAGLMREIGKAEKVGREGVSAGQKRVA